MISNSSTWPEIVLGEVCEFKYGKSLPESKRVVGKVAVYGSNGIIGQHNEAITDGLTIVVGRKGSFGEVNLSYDSCWPIDTTYYIDRTATNADLRWLAYRLTDLGLTELNRAAAVPGLNREDAYRKRLLLPPLAEQRRIAAILDQAEALRAKRRHALAKLDTLTQSLFLEMFGDPASNPKSWPVQRLEKLGAGRAAIVDGPFGSAINVREDYIEDGEIPVIRTKNVRPFEFVADDLKRISRAKFRGLERSSVIPGDIILTKVGTIGNVCVFPADFEIAVLSTTGSCRIRPNESVISHIYLAHFLNLYRSEMLKLVAQGVQPFLNMSHIKSFKVLVPPLPLQREFTAQVSAVGRLKAAQRTSLAKLDALFASLQHRAFRGKL